MTDSDTIITTSSAHGLEAGDEFEFASSSFWSAFEFTFDWREFWVGIRWDRPRWRLHIHPVPMFGLAISPYHIRSWQLGRSGPHRVSKVTTTTMEIK